MAKEREHWVDDVRQWPKRTDTGNLLTTYLILPNNCRFQITAGLFFIFFLNKEVDVATSVNFVDEDYDEKYSSTNLFHRRKLNEN